MVTGRMDCFRLITRGYREGGAGCKIKVAGAASCGLLIPFLAVRRGQSADS